MQNPEPRVIQMPMGGLGSFLTSNMDEIDDNVLAFGRPGGINSFSEIGNRMAQMGRGGDSYVVHASEREVMVPREVVEKNPQMMGMIRQAIANEGADPDAYVVGSPANSINPYTGQREFFLKNLIKGIKNIFKKAATVILPVALNVMFPGLGTIASGAIGAGIGTLIQGGNVKDALKNALIGGAMGGLYSGISGAMSGQGFMEGVKGGLPSAFRPPAPGMDVRVSTSGTGNLVQPEPAAAQPGFMDRAKNFLLPPDPTQAQIAAEAAKTKAAFAAQGMTLSNEAAIEAATKSLTPTLLQKYGPLAATATLAAGAAGAFDTPTVQGPTPFKPPTQEEIDAVRVGVAPRPTFVTAADVMARPTDFYQSYMSPQFAAKGGPMNFPRKTGQISGPGTGTSDSIPAMLSDGEFVMTAKAVRGAGNGSREKGVKKMYQMMRAFEGGAV
jgi:hypothetical protein